MQQALRARGVSPMRSDTVCGSRRTKEGNTKIAVTLVVRTSGAIRNPKRTLAAKCGENLLIIPATGFQLRATMQESRQYSATKNASDTSTHRSANIGALS